ncbi:helix-turn-helix domain-containing protein [Myxococcus sp. RHSTA-1-4]|uniref:helix-turn-helix domain-containing protein n=1 Tax=Myxococcus sp. RHSTA-1-4 TaxID=2874601 RepID=UPI00351D9172
MASAREGRTWNKHSFHGRPRRERDRRPRCCRAHFTRSHAPYSNTLLAAIGQGRLLTVREIAERLGVCGALIYRLCSQGRLPHLRVSKTIPFRPSDNAPLAPQRLRWLMITSPPTDAPTPTSTSKPQPLGFWPFFCIYTPRQSSVTSRTVRRLYISGITGKVAPLTA